MTEIFLQCVLDASVGIKLFIDEDFSDKVQHLFARLAEDSQAEIHIPDLFYIECANILLKYTRRFGRSLKDSQADLVDLSRLALKSTPTADLMENALLLASELDLSAYDACYAVLAQQLGIPLLTADQPLARKLEFAIFLGDLDIQLSEE